MTQQQFLHIFSILDSMQKSLTSYIEKFPDKKTDRFTIERIDNLEALKDFYNNSACEFERMNTEIEAHKRHIRALEVVLENLYSAMIKDNFYKTIEIVNDKLHCESKDLTELEEKTLTALLYKTYTFMKTALL